MHSVVGVVGGGMSGEVELIRRLVRAVGVDPDPVQVEMEARGREKGFPIIGREAGGVLRVIARLVGAEQVLELGSGFGYSASWLAGALPADGRIVLTEYDGEELTMAREYFEQLGYAGLAVFEEGDALEIVESYEGPFEVVLMDHEKARYPEGFAAVREKVPVGGVVLADNVMYGPVELADVVRGAEGETGGLDETTRGLVEYLSQVRGDPLFETVVLPVGNGVSMSVKHREG